jgi:hypothetical protein
LIFLPCLPSLNLWNCIFTNTAIKLILFGSNFVFFSFRSRIIVWLRKGPRVNRNTFWNINAIFFYFLIPCVFLVWFRIFRHQKFNRKIKLFFSSWEKEQVFTSFICKLKLQNLGFLFTRFVFKGTTNFIGKFKKKSFLKSTSQLLRFMQYWNILFFGAMKLLELFSWAFY